MFPIRANFGMPSQALEKELMEWVTALHHRAPGSTVILVGTHKDRCEGGGWCTQQIARLGPTPFLNQAMEDVGNTLNDTYEAWKKCRHKANMSPSLEYGVTVNPDVVFVSSSSGVPNTCNGISDLLDLLGKQNGTKSWIPPSWGLALVVLDALRDGQEPVDAVESSLNRLQPPQPSSDSPTSEKGKITAIDMDFIKEQWNKVQEWLPLEHKARDPSFAMESALALR